MKRSTYWRELLLFSALLILVSSTLVGCSSTPMFDLPDHAPDYLKDAPPEVQEAYVYAMTHPGELENYPCYCGCTNMGHISNLSCYVADIEQDSSVVWDSHAAGCGICVDITQDAMRLAKQGMSSSEIRDYIDATYSYYGPGTDTLYPDN